MKRGGDGGEGPSVEVGAGPNSKLCRCVLVKKERKKKILLAFVHRWKAAL